MKKKISIITAILAVLCMSISVQAETEFSRITNKTINSYENILPAVHGNYVVWQGRYDDGDDDYDDGDGDWEIFLYDIAADQTILISDNYYDDIAPQTDGSYVVWLGMDNRGGNIFFYDIVNGGITQVTTVVPYDLNTECTNVDVPYPCCTGFGVGICPTMHNVIIKSPPRIADGRIVWAAQAVIEDIKKKTLNWAGIKEDKYINVIKSVLPGDIMLYEIETGGTPTIISDPANNLNDHTPLIDSTKVVWVQTGPDNLESTVFVHDLPLTSSGTYPYPAPDNSATVQSPTRDGNLSITTKFDGQDKEIFLSHQRLRKNIQITDNDVEEKQPKIHGNHLVWVSGQGAGQEIYLGTTRLLSSMSPGDGFVLIQNNDINNNGRTGIRLIDAGIEGDEALILDNIINYHYTAGINIGGATYANIENNNIHDNATSGITFNMDGEYNVDPDYPKLPSSGTVTIGEATT
ncbi:right-handed parallel beta-helix repeat-containing protein, partial [Thermodesulfobacteriota bacterium]